MNKKLPLLYRVLLPLEAVIFICLVLSAIVVCFIGLLNLVFGIRISGDIANTGSMRPTIDQGSLIVSVSPKYASFEDLQVGDIISFRDRSDNIAVATASFSINMDVVYLDENGNEYDNADGKGTIVLKKGKPSEVKYASYPTPDDLSASYKDEGIEYQNVNYRIMHRIVAIREADETSDRAIFTQGDNNDERDPKTVLSSGYVSKVIWYCDYLGWPLYFLMHGGYYGLGIALVVIGCVLAIMYKMNPAVRGNLRWLVGLE